MIKRILKTLFVLFLSLILISAFPHFNAAATDSLQYHFDYGCNLRLLNGVGNWGNNTRYYWIDSSALSYQFTISDAVSSWVYTSGSSVQGNVSTPISIARTYTKSSSVFDVYMDDLFSQDQGVLGVTYHYINNDSVNNGPDLSPTQNWYWTQIFLNQPSFTTIGSRNGMGAALTRQSIVAHEFGHALGLAHSEEVDASGYYISTIVMLQLQRGRTVWQPMYADLYVINHLYA